MSSDALEAELSREELLRLLDAVRAMARASGEPDFDRAAQSLLAIVGDATASQHTSLFRVDTAANLLHRVSLYPAADAPTHDEFRTLPLRGSLTGEAALSKRVSTWTIDEVRHVAARSRELGVRHVAAVPLGGRAAPEMVLSLARSVERPYGERDLRFAQMLGELLVLYVENANLYADARRRLDETRMLLDVGRAMSASIEIDRLLATATDVLPRMVDASNSFVMLLDGDDVLCGVATSNAAHRASFRRVRTPLASPSIAAAAIRGRRTVAITDVSSSPEVRRDLVDQLGEKSLLALPLLVQEEPIGAVVIDDTERVREWTPSEIERAELIAQQVAVGLANARLYDEVRRRSVQLERAQQELVKRERLAALGQLAATLAHEVRNPIGVIFNSIGTLGKLLQRDLGELGDDAGAAATLLAIMSEEARRLERLVRELLDFARPLAPSLEPEALGPVVVGAADAAVQEIGPGTANVAVDVAREMPRVRIDASMIRRAVVNLVLNALQAAGPNGAVTVRVSHVTRGDRRFARVDVSDTGPGIAPELASRVFEPFFTTKATGTGLGLAVVKGIVETHGGEVTLESTAKGTTATMFVPVAEDDTEAGVTPSTPPAARAASGAATPR